MSWSPGPSPRDLRGPSGSSYEEYRERWAVLVGISKYRHGAWDLKFGHRDAEELAKLLKQATHGGFEEKHMEVLLNEEATTARVTKALRGFLKKPAK
jgi:hypothetical protein